jgi:subtilisin family serine protease
MKALLRPVLTCVIFFALCSYAWADGGAAKAQSAPTPAEFASAEPTTSVVVGFDPAQQAQAITSALLLGATAPERAKSGGFCVVQVPVGTDSADFALELSAMPGVQYAEPDGVVYATLAATDPGFSSQWGMTKIGAPFAWDLTRGASVKVAVVDTGADLDHPDLVGRLDTSNDYDFVNHDATAEDDHGHGTHVSGIIGATLNNGIGVAGVANQCIILPVKVLSASGSGSSSDVADGIRWAADHGAKVINLSLGGPGYDSVEYAAVQYAVSKDCVIVAAAGNDGAASVLYPAAFNNVIGVGSSASNDALSSFSNYGSKIDVVAPGSLIYSTTMGGGYGYMSGTSMASPCAAGVVALIRAKNPTWNRSQVESQLLTTALDLGAAGRDDYFGYGRVRAAEAVGWTAPAVNGMLAGTVTSGGAALSGVSVSVSGAGSAVSASNGSYSVSAITPGGHSVTFSKSGYSSRTLDVTVASGQTTTLNVLLTAVVAPGALSGSVTTSDAPLPGVSVSIPGVGAVTTGVDGAYSVGGVTPGSYDVTFAKSGFTRQTRSVTISSAVTATEDVSLTPVVPGELSGTVTSGVGPLQGVTVAVPGTGTVTTSAEGTYSVAGVDPGSYSVTFSRGGYSTAVRSVTIAPGETSAENVSMSLGVAATSVSRPSVSPAKPAHGKTAAFSAWVTPASAAVTGTSRLSFYRLEHKTVRAKVRGRWTRVRVHYWRFRGSRLMSGASDGRLSTRYRVPYAGSWRVVASYAGAPGYSASISSAKAFMVR